MKHVRTTLIHFDTDLAFHEIPKFRGAILANIEQADVLLHNHTDEGLRYRYPLVQYKRFRGKAAIMWIEEGLNTLGSFLEVPEYTLRIGERKVVAKIEKVETLLNEVMCSTETYTYHLRRWLPFNKDNYATYRAMDSIIERTKLLERILTGNILSMLKGLDIMIEERLLVTITRVEPMRSEHYKEINFNCFDIEFRCNMKLPTFAGMGRHVSVGYGVICRKDDNEHNERNNRKRVRIKSDD